MKKLEGKIALVTGASRSLGKAMAVALAREGSKLVLAARSAEALEKTAELVRETGSEALTVPMDVRDEAQVANVFDKLMERYGRLDLLVNNAGMFGAHAFENFPTETWDNLIATSLRGPFLCARAAFKIMKKQGGGRIINIGSISAYRVRSENAAYSAAKFGLRGLTETIALEGRVHNISCGMLHPGMTRQDSMQTGDMNIPCMEAEDIAASVVHMACQPANVNILEMVQLPIDQPYLGRG